MASILFDNSPASAFYLPQEADFARALKDLGMTLGHQVVASASALGGALAPDFSKGCIYVVTLDSNLAIGAPNITRANNAKVDTGTRLRLAFVQDATGYRTVTWNAAFKNVTRFLPRQLPNQASWVDFIVMADGSLAYHGMDGIDLFYPLNVADFGAIGDGVADDTAAIQATIDTAMYRAPRACSVDLGHGIYKTSDTIHLGYGISFGAVVFQGGGYAYDAESGFGGAAIVPTFSDRPAINVQGARGTVIRGIALVGKLKAWIDSNLLANIGFTPLVDDTLAANWNDPSLAATADSRYAPYAAITVDAYSGVRPATSYPNVNYPAFLGTVAQYGKAFSSDVLIEDVNIIGFNTAVANQPCDADGNGDFTCLRRVNIDHVKYGVSIGNTQSRNVGLQDVKIATCHTMLVNGKHGRQNGKFGGTITNLSGGSAIQVLDLVNTSIGGPIKFVNCYQESLWRIGNVTTPTGVETAVRFECSQFDCGLQNVTRGIPAYLLDGGGGSLDFTFTGCQFNNLYSVGLFNMAGARFDRCFMVTTQRPVSSAQPAYVQAAHNYLMGGFVMPLLASDPQPIYGQAINLDTGTWDVNPIIRESFLGGARPHCIPCFATSVQNFNGPREAFTTPFVTGTPQDKSLWTGASITGKTLTFTSNSPDWQAFYNGLCPGDVLWDQITGTVFFIRSRVGTSNSTVIAEAQNNFKTVAGVTTLTTTPNLAAGYMYSGNARLYTPTYPLLVDTTAASAVLTNAGRDDGYAGFIPTDIAVGDYVYVSPYTDAWTAQQNAKVTARDGVAATITLSATVTRTSTRRRLMFFIRQPPANA